MSNDTEHTPNDDAINLVAYINPKAAYYQNCKSAIEEIMEITRQEPGCQRFELYENTTHTQLILIERFARQSAFDFHHRQPYTQAVYRLYQDALTCPPELHFLTEA
ncbi:antibiotic biosynthesis monooxygenase [Pseudoalteromonas rubra]|uniref:Antibiotic biosynthesis monooxygenase n=1 Tax=Pseudoalteromonas rubra TaxID=43658 RepID=A0A5S3UWG4_9GAMM|nr:antibiotic biosynthesis monooxygenase [Pseudoalteromonas rubra]QPB81884.1 antibiotic biosynthesis monooxygenase [Pseudoalteromonas rubra]